MRSGQGCHQYRGPFVSRMAGQSSDGVDFVFPMLEVSPAVEGWREDSGLLSCLSRLLPSALSLHVERNSWTWCAPKC